MDQDAPVIYRLTLAVVDEQTVQMHEASEILSVAPTRDGGSDQIDLWFTTYPRIRDRVSRVVRMAGTGMQRPDGQFVGTVVTPSGLVFHVFDGGVQR